MRSPLLIKRIPQPSSSADPPRYTRSRANYEQ
ncbi:hypothetical protein GMORB2_1678 [Geosmithia morbida]|uniref:Uncharacterized protein n=1 Tax=Geosmithia morbida TaxID=1094350 RepID=A0A9P4YRL8_9HYPO|nr:uncharacterized protein GMORB2_1678 [Geosmithia morbida]KAF4121838.1 hypothetical protein GMORB2_1678 [Geosmithia morbida]